MKDFIKTAFKLFLSKGTFVSYSQYGEDAIINSLFRGNKVGTYIDIGAYHPHLYSNTYALYKRGWHGFVVDPNIRMRRLFSIFRPRDIFIHAGVGDTVGMKTYHEYKDGAYNGFKEHTVNSQLINTYKVSVKPLGKIIKEYNISHIDILNIDAEGMDEEIICSYDWSVYPTLILVESNKNTALVSMIENRGYTLVAFSGLTLFFKKLSSSKHDS